MKKSIDRLPLYKSHKEVRAVEIAELLVLSSLQSEDGEVDVVHKIVPTDESISSIEVSAEYMEKHKPEVGGYYVRYKDGYESFSPKKAFEEGYKLITRTANKKTITSKDVERAKGKKTYGNTCVNGAKDNVSDLVVFGNGDIFKLLSKASSNLESWMKSTKAMEIQGVGCVVQVTTQQGDNVAEALTFVPGVKIKEESPTNRTLVPLIECDDLVIKDNKVLNQHIPMKFNPVTGNRGPIPANAAEYREYNGDVAWLYNPWSGKKRDPRDIGSDVLGLLIYNKEK